MTNFDKYYDLLSTTSFGVTNGNLNDCYNISCEVCDFHITAGSCNHNKMAWLKAEYTEPKISIPEGTRIDTRILVSLDGETWGKRYYAGKKNGKHIAFSAGKTSWTADPGEWSTWEYMKLYNGPEREV